MHSCAHLLVRAHDGVGSSQAGPACPLLPSSLLQGMKAGENTLNALCARVVVRGIAATGGWVAAGATALALRWRPIMHFVHFVNVFVHASMPPPFRSENKL